MIGSTFRCGIPCAVLRGELRGRRSPRQDSRERNLVETQAGIPQYPPSSLPPTWPMTVLRWFSSSLGQLVIE